MESLPNRPLTTGLYEHFALWQILSLIFCGIVVAILKMETGRNFAMSGINSEHHLPTYEFLILNFCGIVTAILKILTGRIAPLMVTYHYINVKFYVSIIIHLEVIKINVRNFNFPIGFNSNPTPFEPLKIWLWPPPPQSWKL